MTWNLCLSSLFWLNLLGSVSFLFLGERCCQLTSSLLIAITATSRAATNDHYQGSLNRCPTKQRKCLFKVILSKSSLSAITDEVTGQSKSHVRHSLMVGVLSGFKAVISFILNVFALQTQFICIYMCIYTSSELTPRAKMKPTWTGTRADSHSHTRCFISQSDYYHGTTPLFGMNAIPKVTLSLRRSPDVSEILCCLFAILLMRRGLDRFNKNVNCCKDSRGHN